MVIDQEGKIEAVHVGFEAGIQTRPGKELDELMAGKSLLGQPAAPASPAGP